jgi:hypothetical protein
VRGALCAWLPLLWAAWPCTAAAQGDPSLSIQDPGSAGARRATALAPATAPSSTQAAYDELAAALPLDEKASGELLRDAGPQARRLLTAHFEIAYTGGEQKVLDLSGRLEAVYAAHLRLARDLGLPLRRPQGKLAVLFCARYDEFRAHLANTDAPPDSFGTYEPAANRALFFDLDTHPALDAIRATIERAVPAQREKLHQRLQRRQAWLALSIIQHETAHQVQVNLGLLPASDKVPAWLAEGLATLFEVPLSPAGEPREATNAFRLFEYRKLYRASPPTLEQMRHFLAENQAWTGGAAYPLAWAVASCLRDEHRSGLAALLRKAALDGGLPAAPTVRLATFDELLGPIDNLWLEKFNAYVSGLPLSASAFGD